jgi:hypothetical protein
MKAMRILLLAAGLLALGCTKEYINQGLDMTLIDFTVKPGNWSVREVEYGNDDEGYFEAVLNVPAITQEVVDKGVVMVYRELEPGIWTPLPAIRTVKTILYDEEEGEKEYYYTTCTDFEWQKGKVFIYYTASDLYAGADVNPGDVGDEYGNLYFRVVIQQ